MAYKCHISGICYGASGACIQTPRDTRFTSKKPPAPSSSPKAWRTVLRKRDPGLTHQLRSSHQPLVQSSAWYGSKFHIFHTQRCVQPFQGLSAFLMILLFYGVFYVVFFECMVSVKLPLVGSACNEQIVASVQCHLVRATCVVRA